MHEFRGRMAGKDSCNSARLYFPVGPMRRNGLLLILKSKGLLWRFREKHLAQQGETVARKVTESQSSGIPHTNTHKKCMVPLAIATTACDGGVGLR